MPIYWSKISLSIVIVVATLIVVAFMARSDRPKSNGNGNGSSSSNLSMSSTTPTPTSSMSPQTTYVAVPSVAIFTSLMPKASSSISPTPRPGGLAMVSLNFDDGFISAYRNALPIFDKAGLKTTQYIITHKFGDSAYVTSADVLDMQAHGHEIGAHTRTHPHLTQLTEAQMRDEIVGSKQDLLAIGVHNVETFAYPYGDFNDTVKRIVQQAGFAAARTTRPGFDDSSSDRYELRRYSVDAPTTFAQAKQWIDAAQSRKVWLILVFHRIDEDGNPISARHELVQEIADYLVKTKIPVVTTVEAIHRLS